jgi:hypothetical protein
MAKAYEKPAYFSGLIILYTSLMGIDPEDCDHTSARE